MIDLEKALDVEEMPSLIREELNHSQINLNGTHIVLKQVFKKPYQDRPAALSQDEILYIANSDSHEVYAIVRITDSSANRTELNVEPVSGVALNHILDPSVDLIIYTGAMRPKSIKGHRHPPESQPPKSRYR